MGDAPVDLPLALRRRPSQAQARLSAMARGSPSRSPLLGGAQQPSPPPSLAASAVPGDAPTAHPLYVPLPSMSESTLMQLHRQLQLAAQHAARMQAAAAAAEADAANARRAAAMLQPGATIPCVCPHMTTSALAAVPPGHMQPRCTCGAAAAASSAESSAAAAASPAEAAAPSAAVTDKAADALQRSVAWAKSASRLRSSLLSAYAAFAWFTGRGGSGGGGGGGAHHAGDLVAATTSGAVGMGSSGGGFFTPVELVSPHLSDAMASAGGMVRNASSAAMSRVASSGVLQSLTQRAFGSTASSSASRQSTLHVLRRLVRAVIFFARVYSRRFHRLLRPHLLLLLRSRALSRFLGMVFPFLRRNLLMASHVAFVYGSVVILLKRYALLLQRQTGQAQPAAAVAGSQALPAHQSVLASLVADVRAAIPQLLVWTLQRWRSLRLSHKVALVFASSTLLFLLFTCVQIVREYRRHRAARRQALLDARAAETIAALQLAGVGVGMGSTGCAGGVGVGTVGGGWSPEQLRSLLLSSSRLARDHSPDISPEPSPDPSPLHTPCLSASASHAHDLDALSLDESAASTAANVSPVPDASRHHSDHSFHSACGACIASVIAESAASASYTHNHPPVTTWEGAVHSPTPGALFRTPPQTAALSFAAAAASSGGDASAIQQGPGPTSSSSSSMQMYPLVSAISQRLEWACASVSVAGAGAVASSSSAAAAAAPPPAPLAHGGVAPGTPVSLSSASSLPSLSFISPASRRLTSIKLSKLRQQEDSFERVRPALHEHVQIAYGQTRQQGEEQQQQPPQQQQQQQQQQQEPDQQPPPTNRTHESQPVVAASLRSSPSRSRRPSSSAVAALWRPAPSSPTSSASETAAPASAASMAAPARPRSAAPYAQSSNTPRSSPPPPPPPAAPPLPRSATPPSVTTAQLIDDERLLDEPVPDSLPPTSALSPRTLAEAVGSATSTFRSLFLRQH